MKTTISDNTQQHRTIRRRHSCVLFRASTLTMALLCAAAVICGTAAGAATTFSSQLLVSEGHTPDVAVDGSGVIYVVWEELFPWGMPLGDYIFISKSSDGGTSFAPKVPICKGEDFVSDPSIAIASSGNIHVVWLESDEYPIYYANSIDGGSTFSDRVKVSDAVASCLTHPDVAVDSNGVIYVVWGGDDDCIYIDKSTDGTTFGTDVSVNDSFSVVGKPSIAIDSDDTILVAWSGRISGMTNHVYLAKSTDSGATFSAAVRVDDSTSEARYPSIVVDPADSSKIYVAWEDYRDICADIYAAASTGGGATFGAGVKVNDDTTDTDHRFPCIATDSCGRIFAVWQDARNSEGTPDIYSANSTNSGSSFNTNVKMNSINGTASYGHKYPALAVNDTNIFVAWQGTDGAPPSTWLIYFAKADIPVLLPAHKRGDVNSDGEITTADAVIVLEIAVGSRPCDAAMLAAADVSGDDRVTSLDALMILQAAKGHITL